MKTRLLLHTLLALAFAAAARTAPLDDKAAQARVDARLAEVTAWAADPVIVGAVSAQNASLPPALAAMAQDKWKTLPVLDPFVRGFNKNEAGVALKAKKAEWVTEAFISDASGRKVAFLSKPSNWSHTGNPKHDDPMAGKTWQGRIEVDESTGIQQLQISVPVLVNGKPAGSLVVGLSLLKI